MTKLITIAGRLAAGTFVLSAFFKIMHWMGAPSLLLLSTLLAAVFIIGRIGQKLRKAK